MARQPRRLEHIRRRRGADWSHRPRVEGRELGATATLLLQHRADQDAFGNEDGQYRSAAGLCADGDVLARQRDAALVFERFGLVEQEARSHLTCLPSISHSLARDARWNAWGDLRWL